jgi:hypothetical protein
MTLDGAMALCGYIGVVGMLAAIIFFVSDRREEQQRAGWPRATARVQRCDVERVHSRIRNSGGPSWHIQCSGRIDVDGTAVRVSLRSHGVYRAAEVQELRAWVARHDTGSSVSVRYDPEHPRSAIPEPSSMPHVESRVPGDTELGIVFGAGGALLFLAAAIVRRRANAGPGVSGPFTAST